MVTQCPRHLSSGRSVTQPHPVASQMMSRPEDRGDSSPGPGHLSAGSADKPEPGGALASQLHLPSVTFASRTFIGISQGSLPLHVSPVYRRGTEAREWKGPAQGQSVH